MDEVLLRHPCPACGFLVFLRRFGSGDTCPVCGWVDDYLQLAHPDFVFGGNPGKCLREAQACAVEAFPLAFRTSGPHARDSRWRPLGAGEDPGHGTTASASPVCYLDTPDEEEFQPYWLDLPSLDANP